MGRTCSGDDGAGSAPNYGAGSAPARQQRERAGSIVHPFSQRTGGRRRRGGPETSAASPTSLPADGQGPSQDHSCPESRQVPSMDGMKRTWTWGTPPMSSTIKTWPSLTLSSTTLDKAGTQPLAPWMPTRSCFVEGPHCPLPPRSSRSQIRDDHNGAPGRERRATMLRPDTMEAPGARQGPSSPPTNGQLGAAPSAV